MKFALMVIAMTLLAACATNPKRIACEAHLVPINPPAATALHSEHTP